MKIKLFILSVLTVLLISSVFSGNIALADEVEWKIQKTLNLQEEPIDSALSDDGQTLFVLTPGKVLVYSTSQEKITGSIPVTGTFDRLAYSPRENKLFLTDRTKKTLEIVRLEFIKKVDIAGLPFKGEKNAPVTIAVFSDYQ